MEERTTIKVLYNKGHGIKTIASLLGHSRNTIRKYVRSDELPQYRRTKEYSSIWDAYREDIEYMYFQLKFRRSRIYRELIKKGAQGGKSSFYDYFNKLIENVKQEQIHERFETGPGEQAQFDWSEYAIKIGDSWEKVYIFQIILSYSRKKFFFASKDIKQFSVFYAIEKSFEYFGGTVKELLVDNARQMRHIIDKKHRSWNPHFLNFLGHYGVEPKAHKVRHPFTKGKVERPFKDLEEDFVKGSSFASWEELNEKLKQYSDEVNQQFHSTIRQAPDERFLEEQPYLGRLPEPFFLFHKDNFRKVSMDCLVSFQGSRYSVPYTYAGKHVWIYPICGHTLQIYSQKGKLIATHFISNTKGETIINDDHYKGLRKTTPKSSDLIRSRFLELFPTEEDFLRGISAVKRFHWKTHVRRIIELTQLYKVEHVRKAIQQATEKNIFTYDYIFHYLKKNFDIDSISPKENSYSLITTDDKDSIIRDLNEYDKIAGE